MKFLGTIATDLSGSLNGVVASRNKGGAYFRARVTPTNPQTEVQMANRAIFASAGSSFHNLAPSAKAGFNAFATSNHFNPIGGRKPNATYSGQNAYTSLQMVTNRSNSVVRAADFDGATITGSSFAPPNVAPTSVMSSQLSGLTPGTQFPLVVDSNGSATFTLQSGQINLPFILGNGITVPVLPQLLTESGGGTRVGINVYLRRNFVEQDGLAMGGQLTLVGSTGLISVTTPTSAKPVLEFTSGDWNLTGRKLLPVVGNIVRLEAYLVNIHGQGQPLGVVNATVI